MEQTLSAILEQGVTWPLFLALLKILVIIFVGLAIRNWMTGLINRRLAFRRLKSNKYLKAGSWVEWPTTTGSVVTKVDRITPVSVVLRTQNEGKWLHIPILQFANSPLALLDTAPAGE